MKYLLKYGNVKREIKIIGGIFLGSLEPKKTIENRKENEIIKSALKKPVNSTNLRKFVQPEDRILIVIPDKTRLSRLNIVLPEVFRELKYSGIENSNIKFIFANGSHSKQSKDEKEKIIGKKYFKSYEILEHDAYDSTNILYFGRTDRGTKVYLNKIIKESDKIITIGAVSHHYFAGFGGGAKMIFPGLAYYKTIEQNHKRSISNCKLNNKCLSGVLKDNPIYEDLSQVVNIIPPVFSICMMLDEKGKIIAAKTGDIIKSHKSISELINKKYRIKIKKKSDLVVCSSGGYPKDINIIQTHKAIYNAYQAVKENGVIICFAECKDGIGSKTFLDWFGYNKKDLKKNISKNYSLNAQTALSVIEKTGKVNIILISKLDQDIVKKMGMIPVCDNNDAFIDAQKYLNNDFSYYVIKNSSLVVPFLDKGKLNEK